MIMRKSFNLFEPQFIPLCKKAGFRKLYLNELLNCSDKTLFIPTVSALDLACEPQFTEPWINTWKHLAQCLVYRDLNNCNFKFYYIGLNLRQHIGNLHFPRKKIQKPFLGQLDYIKPFKDLDDIIISLFMLYVFILKCA